MENVTFIESVSPLTNQVETHAIIDQGNGGFTSMLKLTYDQMHESQSILDVTE